jgi:NDP-sugar pyrophosphorylase family protein
MPTNPLSTLPVLILAGGLGTRLRPVVADRPKGLAPIGEKPFLEIQIELLREQGADRFVLCVGHRAEQIREHFGDGRRWGVRIDYSIETGELLGTAGALKLAEARFDPQALVLNGDTYFALDYRRLVERHRAERRGEGVLATIALAQTPDPSRCGNVVLDPSQRYLLGFLEKDLGRKQPSRWLNAGAYVLERELLDRLSPGRPYSLERDVFPEILRTGGRIAALTGEELFLDIGTPEGLGAFAAYYDDLRRARRPDVQPVGR